MQQISFLDFFFLTDPEKLSAVDRQGVRIASRTNNGYAYQLYQLNDFYIEIGLPMQKQLIMEFFVFESGSDGLDPYLENIDISELAVCE